MGATVQYCPIAWGRPINQTPFGGRSAFAVGLRAALPIDTGVYSGSVETQEIEIVCSRRRALFR
jgi:hypothetical protein